MARSLANIMSKSIAGFRFASSNASKSFSQKILHFSTTLPDDPDTHEDFKPTSKIDNSSISLKDIVEQDVKKNPVMIYMKGIPDLPRCEFSALAVRVLKEYIKRFVDPVVIFGGLKFDQRINKFEKTISFLYTSKRRYSGSPSVASLESFYNDTHPILQSSGLQHWFKNWQHLRKDKLTASTFALAVGFWPRGRTRLWLEKLGAIEPFSGNLATCWSNIKEEEALERYKLITGSTLSYPYFQVYGEKNLDDNWLAASPDGTIDSYVYGLPTRGVLEIKCPFFGGNMTKSSPWQRLPVHYIPQAQGLMEILDRDWMDMYVWTVNGSSLFRLERDVEYWNVLKIALSDFWWKHVQPAKEICNNRVITNPLIELRSLRPSPKHDLHRCIICESKRVIDNSKLLMREIHGKLQN